jgi:hypothetical protein
MSLRLAVAFSATDGAVLYRLADELRLDRAESLQENGQA